jgi:putative Mn2+ efflux pump MntP
MDIVTLLIAISLAMDSFSVAITRGLSNPESRIAGQAVKVAFYFGLFQGLMPIIGWTVGVSIIEYIAGIDHWVAFGLLSIIGVRMIYEAIQTESEQLVSSSRNSVLLMLAVATSIDALAVGLSYSLMDISIVAPAMIIGIITFGLSFIGVYIGKRFGTKFEKIGMVGGVILIGIGIKILMDHVLLS